MTTSNIHGKATVLSFSVLRGVCIAASAVSSGVIGWIVAQTQPNMLVRAWMQVAAGLAIIFISPFAFDLATGVNKRKLVAVSASAMALLAASLVAAIRLEVISSLLLLGAGICIAVVEAIYYPAQEAYQNALTPSSSQRVDIKKQAVKLRTGVQFGTRVVVATCIAVGVLNLKGLQPASVTFLVEAGVLMLGALLVLRVFPDVRGSLYAGKVPSAELVPTPRSVTDVIRSWLPDLKTLLRQREMRSLFVTEFSLQGFAFLGGMMLPKILPPQQLSYMTWILALGALGSLLGIIVSRPLVWLLWAAAIGDALVTLLIYRSRSVALIYVGWFLACFCYGILENIFSRAIQAGSSDDSAGFASLRRLMVHGLKPLCWIGLIYIQLWCGLSERGIVTVACGISLVLLTAMLRYRSEVSSALLAARTA